MLKNLNCSKFYFHSEQFPKKILWKSGWFFKLQKKIKHEDMQTCPNS